MTNIFDEREFVEIAKKIMKQESLNRALMDSLPYPAMLIRNDRRIIIANKTAKELGVTVGSYCWDTFGQKASISTEDKDYYENNKIVPEKGIKCTFCKANEALSTQKLVNERIPAGDIIYDTYWIPLTEDVYLHYAIVLK